MKFTYKCECRGGFKYQIKEKGKSKECVGEFQLAYNSHNIGQNYLHFTQKGLLFTTKLKKGRYKESTIRGHRKKKLSHRNSKPRSYAVHKSSPKKVTLARQRVLSTQWLEHGGSWVRIPSGVQIFSMLSYG